MAAQRLGQLVPELQDEHPDLMDLKRRSVVPIVGLNYKDKRDLGFDVLRKTGDPTR